MIKKQHTFVIDHFSEMDDRQYTGTFTCKKLSIMDLSKVNVRKSQLSGGSFCVKDDNGNPTGQGLDELTDGLNNMLAMLEITLIQSPEWWKLDEISDEELVVKVFKEVMSYENSFRGRRNGEATPGTQHDESRPENGAAQPQASQSDNGPKKVVDKQVQAALDA